MFNFLLQTEQVSMTPTLIMFALIFVIFYFFIIRPQNKKQKETEKMIASLKKGDKIITIGGIHGTVAATKEQTVIIKVDDNTKIEFNRTAISSVIVDKPAKEEKAEKADKKAKKADKAEKAETAEKEESKGSKLE
ncbi:MAG: preprotein translocase subunit YajC [Treponema sp.]|nr:preprotein translocase subunit YajC [Candidatus Treponema caballi]